MKTSSKTTQQCWTPKRHFLRYVRPRIRKYPQVVDFPFVSRNRWRNKQLRSSGNHLLRRSYRYLLGIFENKNSNSNQVKLSSVKHVKKLDKGRRVVILDCHEYTPIRYWLVTKFPTSFSVLDDDLMQWSTTWKPCQEVLDLIAAFLTGCSAYFDDHSYHGDLEDLDNIVVRQLPPKRGQGHGDIEVRLVPVDVCRDGRTMTEAQEADYTNIVGVVFGFIIPPDDTNSGYPFEVLDFKERLRANPSMSWRANLLALGSLSDHPLLWPVQQRKDFVVQLMIASENSKLGKAKGPNYRPTVIEELLYEIPTPGATKNRGVYWQDALFDNPHNTLAPREIINFFSHPDHKYPRETASFCRFLYNLFKHIGDWYKPKEEEGNGNSYPYRTHRRYIDDNDELWLDPKYVEHQVSCTFPSYLVDLYYHMLEHGYNFRH